MLPASAPLAQLRSAPAMPTPAALPPQQVPIVSWSPGAVLAVSIGIYPDAWVKLDDQPRVLGLLENAFCGGTEVSAGWEQFCAALEPIWRAAAEGGAKWSSTERISHWALSVLTRAALSGAGRSVRSIERRTRRLSGQTRRSLDFFASFENLHRLAVRAPQGSLADLALQAGYADQSHMGRAVRRGTGFSPARLNLLIATSEAFWCYRLLGERF